jgi:hypothetical protein
LTRRTTLLSFFFPSRRSTDQPLYIDTGLRASAIQATQLEHLICASTYII